VFGRRMGFWVAVGGTAILANFLLEVAAHRLPVPGLAQFAAFTHCGGPQGGNN